VYSVSRTLGCFLCRAGERHRKELSTSEPMWRAGPRLPGRRGSVPGRHPSWGRKDPPLSSDRSCWSAGSCLC